MSDSLELKVRTLVATTFQVPLGGVTRQSSKQTVASWDSMATLHLASALESELNVSLTIDEVSELISVDAILAMLRAKGVA